MQKHLPFFCILLTVIGSCKLSSSRALGEEKASSTDFFESRIRPALVEHCLECHAADTEINGGLSLDSATAWQRGGDTGLAIEKGAPEKSLLVKAIEYDDPNLQMPPDGKLPDDVIESFRHWIREGAIDPRGEVQTKKASTALPLERAQEHWAYRPILIPQLPTGTSSSAIDALVESRLESEQLKPTDKATRSVLIRRLMFDLHGLPPTPEQIESFVFDGSEDAYERLVDSLLASPRYAERFARHWDGRRSIC